MNIIIAGSRHFKPTVWLYGIIEEAVSEATGVVPWSSPIIETIFSGGASGVDRMGEAIAYRMGFYLRKFPALWAIHGKKAGVIRNREMASQADALVLVWDGVSRGSANMLMEAKKSRLKIVQRIIDIEEIAV
jgi:hypothetical protein